MKKVVALLLIILICQTPYTAYAGWIYENGERILSPDSFTEDGKIKVKNPYGLIPDLKIAIELPKVDINIPKFTFFGADSEKVTGVMTYPNIEDIIPGTFNLQWVFTPDNDKYETVYGVFEVTVYPEDSDASKGIMPILATDEPTAPSLTATTVSLNTMTAYDINLDNKVSGSAYAWTSSDPETVEVNPKSGYLRAKKEGKATVTCQITYPDGNGTSLTSFVTVGYDENAPLLTETSLDLETGDVFDINLENRVTKSKYRWVSSDKSIVKVNSSSGKVRAMGPGEAYVTCTITTPDKQIIVLRCDINVTVPASVTE